MKRNFIVYYNNSGLFVFNKKIKKEKRYSFQNFVYGQLGYKEETGKYPNSVHCAVWKIQGLLTYTHENY